MSIILVLADSRKKREGVNQSGYCVAGKDLNSNAWIRIVASPAGGALTWAQKAILDQSGTISHEPLWKTLDIQPGSHVPLNYQPENYLIAEVPWHEVTIPNINITYDNPPDLWGDGDRIHKNLILTGNIIIKQSLYFVQVNNLDLYKNNYSRRRMAFDYNNIHYDLAATMENQIFDDMLHGRIQHRNSLVISLGEPWEKDDCHYKLIASIR
jgi:hypothetical protein